MHFLFEIPCQNDKRPIRKLKWCLRILYGIFKMMEGRDTGSLEAFTSVYHINKMIYAAHTDEILVLDLSIVVGRFVSVNQTGMSLNKNWESRDREI